MDRTVKEIFVEASDLAPADREAFLASHCGADSELRGKVQALLDAHEQAEQFLSTPTSAPPTRPGHVAAATPRQIGPYKVLQEIGEGGFGTVYLAEQEHPVRRRVALKIIKAGMDTRQVIARFEAERQALAMMDHPNIARVLDAGATDTGLPYFVMELVKGVPVTRFCDDQKLDIEGRLRLFSQVCGAVQHAHQKGIIHRDIKPSNVLVSITDDKPLVKVIDFGIAKATQSRLTEKTLFTEFRQMIGTPEYMSPEQADVGGLDVDTRSDVYSLGVLLYELLTGVTPFEAAELRAKAYDEIQRIIREVDPPRPSTRLSTLAALPTVAANRHVEPRQLRSRVQGELDWIVMKCLEKDRGRRYDSVSALADDIGRHLSDEPITAHPASRWYRLRKSVRRHKGPVTAVVAVLFALVAGVIGTSIGLVQASRQRDLARQQTTEAKRQADNASAIVRFQTDMLSTADPDRFFGDKVTVLQAIDAAVDQLDKGALKTQPLVEAEVRRTIAGTLFGLGRFDKAEPNYRRSVELYRAATLQDRSQLARIISQMGINYYHFGRYDDAERCYREAMEIERQFLPGTSYDYAAELNNMGMLLMARRDYEGAERSFKEAIDIYRRTVGPDDANLAVALTNLGTMLNAVRRFDEAEAAHREAVGINERTLPARSVQLAISRGNLGGVLENAGKLDQAEPLLLLCLNTMREVLPATHPELAKAVMMLAGLRMEQKNLLEAEKLYVESVAIHKASLPPDHPNIATNVFNLANIYWKLKKYPEAEATFRESLAIDQRTHPPGDPEVLATQCMLAWVLKDAGKNAESESLCRELLVTMQSNKEVPPELVARTRFILGMALMGQKRLPEAETELLAAEQVYAPMRERHRTRYGQVLDVLVRLYVTLDQQSPGQGFAEKARQFESRRPSTVPASG